MRATACGSESLCKLLKYLGEHSLDSPGMSLKEYQIATEVFGRPADFDSRVDSTVRVQTGRLRSKLAEYYAGEGAPDRLVIEIPKGAYSLTYHIRPPLEAPAPLAALAAPPALQRRHEACHRDRDHHNHGRADHDGQQKPRKRIGPPLQRGRSCECGQRR